MKAADHIALALEKHGVTHVYELVGGMITFMLDALHRRGNIHIVSMHHEQAAGFAAEGHARMTGHPVVALATSGPGATNLLTAIGSCYFDSVPAVFITGQVNRHEMRGASGVRQLGFQETDIVAMAHPVTKAAWLVNDPSELPSLIGKAFALATEGRPGPVLLDIPMDVQRAEVAEPAEVKAGAHTPTHGHGDFLDKIQAALDAASRPLLIAGGGCAAPGIREHFQRLVENSGIPVALSLLGIDLLHSGHPLRLGLLGSYGNRWVNRAIASADLILVLGSRLDVRQTGADIASFVDGKRVFHVDIDASELNNRVTGCEVLVADLKDFLPSAARLRAHDGIGPWIAQIRADEARWPDTAEIDTRGGINPNAFLKELSLASSPASAFVTDVGQHQMWSAQSLRLRPGQRFLTSGGMGAMGFGLPAAIGATFASAAPVVMISGDGGMQLNIQELQTVVHHALPIKMVVLNNGCHGMVRQFQESYFSSRFQSTRWGYSAPGFAKVARAYGIHSSCIETPEEIPSALAELWRDKAPMLLEVIIPPDANAYPKMAFGKPISEMEPFAKPLDMEGT